MLASFMVLFFTLMSSVQAQELYQFKGKTYDLKSLSAKTQQSIFDAEDARYRSILGIIENQILEEHIKELASKGKKSEIQVREELFKVNPPTEKEMKSYYDAKKHEIPYDYQQIKDKLREHMLSEKKFDLRDKLIEKLKKQGNFAYKMTEPQAPMFSMDLNGYASKGDKKSKVTVVEFADYMCPHCREAHGIFKDVFAKLGKKINYVYVDFPINESGISKEIAKVAYCIRSKNEANFWKYHNYVFENQNKITANSPIEFAKTLKLHNSDLDACVNTPGTVAFINKSKALGESVGVSGTPGIYINGRKAVLSHDANEMIEKIKKYL